MGLHDPEANEIEKRFPPHYCRHWFTTLRRSRMQREFSQELRGDTRSDTIDIYDHIDRKSCDNPISRIYLPWDFEGECVSVGNFFDYPVERCPNLKRICVSNADLIHKYGTNAAISPIFATKSTAETLAIDGYQNEKGIFVVPWEDSDVSQPQPSTRRQLPSCPPKYPVRNL